MKVVHNFFFDWYKILGDRLKNKGIKIKEMEDDDIVSAYFNLRERLIPQKNRKIRRAKEFNLPKQYSEALCNLEKIVTSGGDLTPYLSRQISSPINKKDKTDKFLSDWGIHHFHLGDKLDKTGSIEGTKELLFAMVDDENFYEIGIYDHSSWFNTEILNIIHKNWPDLISHYKLPFRTRTSIDSDSLKALRNGNVFVPIQIGNTLYFPFGGGITTSGHSDNAERKSDRDRDKIKNLIANIQTFNVPSFVGEQDSIKCRLVEVDGRIYVESIFFRKKVDLS